MQFTQSRQFSGVGDPILDTIDPAYKMFVLYVGTGVDVDYVILSETGAQWEAGTGQLAVGGGISRDTVTDNSLGTTAKVDFDVGRHLVVVLEKVTATVGAIDAIDVVYDNATSGLAATNVQAAIDELAASGGGGDPADDLSAYILTLSPTGYWKCDETSGTTVNDYGSANADLTLANTYSLEGGTLVAGSTDRYIRFSSLAATDGKAEAASGLGLTMPLTGDWTVTWLVGGMLGNVEYMRALSIGGDGGSGESANNYQFAVGIDNTKENLFAFWEYGSGSFELLLIDANMSTIDSGRRLACAIVKDGTANTVTGYVDGFKVGSTSYTNEPSAGSGTMYTTIGAPNPFLCRSAVTGHVAFFNGTKLTDAQIAEIARLAGRD